MPLKLAQFKDPAVLNRWADGIEQRLDAIPPPVTPPKPVSFKTNSVANKTQGILNLVAGANIKLTPDLFGNTIIAATATTDNLIHGDSIWEIDPGFNIWRDDFNTSGVAFTADSASARLINGELTWAVVQGTSAVLLRQQSAPPNIGVIQIQSVNAGPNVYSTFCWQGAGFAPAAPILGGIGIAGMPLLDYPSWKMIWTFAFTSTRQNTSVSVFPVTKKSLYIGLSACAGTSTFNPSTVAATPNCARPPFFVGLRFDTDPGGSPGGGSAFAVTAVTTGTGAYTGTFTGGGSNAFVGATFTVAGFGNANNNGTFICTASTAILLTLNNPNSVAQSGATATAGAPAISDSTFHFEAVANANNTANPTRNNLQGTVVNTSITPTGDVFYTFEMTCTVAGTVTMTLRGNGSNFSSTIVVPKEINKGQTGSLQLTFLHGNGLMELSQAANAATITSNPAFGPGSKITVTGASNTNYNGTFPIAYLSGVGRWAWFVAGSDGTESNSAATITAYPTLAPRIGFGNDSQTSSGLMSLSIDFFSLVWNPGVAGLKSATPDPTKSRYW